jgi:hypothetical protein
MYPSLTVTFVEESSTLREFIASLGEDALYAFDARAAKDIPFKMAGVIPSLKRKGLVEAYRKSPTPGSKKKQTFLKAKERE